MGPIAIALQLAEFAPAVARWLKGDRAAEAAQAVIGVAQRATAAFDPNQALESIKASEDSRAAFAAAIEVRASEFDLMYLTEAGGGGIAGARQADADIRRESGVSKSAAFLIALALLPMAYVITGSIAGLWGAEWPPEVRAALAASLISLIVGGISGYYYGQTAAQNRRP